MSAPETIYGEWNLKGATLSDKTAQKEYGLTWGEILAGINAGKLQYREQSIYGAPFLRLLRREVEALVSERRGAGYLLDRKTKTEVARINRELKQLQEKIAQLEEKKSKLLACRSE